MRESHHPPCLHHRGAGSWSRRHYWGLTYWIVGLGSLIWLVVRSGANPKRLTYPCQRAAAATGLGFVAYLASLVGSAALVRRLKTAFSPATLLLGIGLLLIVSLNGSIAGPVPVSLAASPTLPGWTSASAVSNVFAVTNVPVPLYSLNGGTIPSGVSPADALHDTGVDALVNLMEAHGDYFYKTVAHPAGLFAANDVVVIKINDQWAGRNSTNTDVAKGVIYRLVQHPEGFSGAVLIAENTQGQRGTWYSDDGTNSNSQFQNQSYQEVAQAFAGAGYHVCIADWNSFFTTFVGDYDTGNSTNGYVLDATDNKLSYPKFQVNCNGLSLQVSMRKGLWNGSTFDNTRLKMINLPVLKRHNSARATIAVKNYLGFITTADNGSGRWSGVSEMHCWLTGPSANGYSCSQTSTDYGLIARQMARIRRADLDLVDAIWANPCDNAGWHGAAQRQDVLLASRDPFAVDYYTSDYVLGPLIQQYGGTCSVSDYTQSMASTHGGYFRNIQLRNVARLRAEGVTNTINMSDSLTRQQELDQFNVYVADANEPASPSLTLNTPNGGETWTVGTQQQIRWSSSNLAGNIHLDYSTNSFASATDIVASTPNSGVFTWTLPNDPSANVRVRVSSTLTATISDTSDAVFSIVGPHIFEDSFKQASHAVLRSGDTLTYTIVLYEATSATLTLTDTIPAPLTYVAGSANINPAWKGSLIFIVDSIYWSGTVTGTQPVTITFQARAPDTDTTRWVVNRAQVSRNGAAPRELTATSILNARYLYLPLILKEG